MSNLTQEDMSNLTQGWRGHVTCVPGAGGVSVVDTVGNIVTYSPGGARGGGGVYVTCDTGLVYVAKESL